MCNLKFILPVEILIVFHNGINYDYHFHIKVPTEECEGQFTCLGENTEHYKTSLVQTEKKKLQELINMEKKSQKTYLREKKY